jgi:hypothetical protein
LAVVADLLPITKAFVVAGAVVRHVGDAPFRFVAPVHGTLDIVVDGDTFPRLAVVHEVAGFCPGAEESIIAARVHGGLDHTVLVFVACPLGTRHRVLEIHRRSWAAADVHQANLAAIAEEVVLAGSMVGEMGHPILAFVARVHGAGYVIIEDRACPGEAVFYEVTNLLAIAEEGVVAAGGVG